ncbi:iron complex transport system ATP-binding protein [Austwickia chelonae]|uniref:Putative ABC transporter ATP-binding protein n=1 Tax=Austwickia chelonae NBRC 105200 TaxID=1184607 RepID=K6UM82_9MICO|nr:ABC transporter ATP-binding protein [Austwickia chelonae]GAB77886.1 putative ABC transporter ATP-binding protein [Austwickia chelonae NBRC 105200]SEV91526.1 iron complex transport system ATP-binding protein [Austwickia chelonae]
MNSTPDALSAREVTIRRGDRLVVDGVGFTARAGTTVGVIGPNGAGKSSLLLALHRAITHESGTIELGADEIGTLSRRRIARHVAVVAQENEAALPLSVRDSVNLGRLPHRSLVGYGDAQDRERVDEALDRVGLGTLAERLVTELSGGERQRVLIARAIVQNAPFLLLDEPTNHLDLHHQFQLFELVRTLDTTTVVVLHDLNLAGRVCDELVLLDRGRPVAYGPPREVLTPQIVSAVYHVAVECLEHHGQPHLLFSPGHTHRSASPCQRIESVHSGGKA